jgi:hypothetical protein
MKISFRFDLTTVTQTIAAVALALLLSKLTFGVSYTAAIVAAIGTYLAKDHLAPSSAFWSHTPSYSTLIAAFVFVLLYWLTGFALLASVSVVLLSVLGGLVFGRRLLAWSFYLLG